MLITPRPYYSQVPHTISLHRRCLGGRCYDGIVIDAIDQPGAEYNDNNCAESFKDSDHLESIAQHAQSIVNQALAEGAQ